MQCIKITGRDADAKVTKPLVEKKLKSNIQERLELKENTTTEISKIQKEKAESDRANDGLEMNDAKISSDSNAPDYFPHNISELDQRNLVLVVGILVTVIIVMVIVIIFILYKNYRYKDKNRTDFNTLEYSTGQYYTAPTYSRTDFSSTNRHSTINSTNHYATNILNPMYCEYYERKQSDTGSYLNFKKSLLN